MHAPDHPLGSAVRELNIFLNDPRYDQRLLSKAGLTFDPSLMPLLVRLGTLKEAGVVQLAAQLGRDHSTVSRQMNKLEAAGLLKRLASSTDGRVRRVCLTSNGLSAFHALGKARIRLLDEVLKDWTKHERAELERLLLRFVRGLQSEASAKK